MATKPLPAGWDMPGTAHMVPCCVCGVLIARGASDDSSMCWKCEQDDLAAEAEQAWQDYEAELAVMAPALAVARRARGRGRGVSEQFYCEVCGMPVMAWHDHHLSTRERLRPLSCYICLNCGQVAMSDGTVRIRQSISALFERETRPRKNVPANEPPRAGEGAGE